MYYKNAQNIFRKSRKYYKNAQNILKLDGAGKKLKKKILERA